MTSWKKLFEEWPAEMPRRGVLVTNYAEQVPFDGFVTTEEMVLVERATPDSLGARALILPFAYISAVKLTDVLKPKALETAGFRGNLSKR